MYVVLDCRISIGNTSVASLPTVFKAVMTSQAEPGRSAGRLVNGDDVVVLRGKGSAVRGRQRCPSARTLLRPHGFYAEASEACKNQDETRLGV